MAIGRPVVARRVAPIHGTPTGTSVAAGASTGGFSDVLLRRGTVIDGTKAPRYDADVGIRDGRIATLGRGGSPGDVLLLSPASPGLQQLLQAAGRKRA